MNFTPLMAHRYLQNQINEIGKTILTEKKLNAEFRDEFSSLQHFKFFCEDSLNGLDATIKHNKVQIDEINEKMNKQKQTLDLFQNSQGDFGSMLKSVDKTLNKQRNLYKTGLSEIKNDLMQTKVRVKRAEIQLFEAINKVKFQDEQRTTLLTWVQEQVVPVKDLRYQQTKMRREQAEALFQLETKLNKSYEQLTIQIDNLKNPVLNMMQDIDKQS